MALILRYVNKKGKVIERFLSIAHVKDTSTKSLKEAVYSLLLEHSLSKSQIRGQGYDGASNMQGEINGLKTLIMNDTPSAYCIHCFAHQLQLTLVLVAIKYYETEQFFDILVNILNIVGGSFKRREMLRDDQAEKLEELLVFGEVHTGSGLNQELGLQRAEVFYAIIDLQLSELNNRFNEVNTDLLLGMASLSPDNSFANYDKDKIMKLATHYRMSSLILCLRMLVLSLTSILTMCERRAMNSLT
nr:PREDICTED: zinc finger MYM-type protein 1-like [Nicotiana tabacum]